MINAFPPFTASPKFTLLPGEFSTKTSRSGSRSPTLMKAREETEKLLLDDEAAVCARRRRRAGDAIVEWVDEVGEWKKGLR